MKVSSCSKRLKVWVNLRYVKCLWVSTCLRVQLSPLGHPSLTVFSLPSVHRAALEMELLPLWLCLGFHLLTVEWRTRSGVAAAACQRCCQLVSFPRNSELSAVPVLKRFDPFGKLMGCQSERTGVNESELFFTSLAMMPCATCSLTKS